MRALSVCVCVCVFGQSLYLFEVGFEGHAQNPPAAAVIKV
jgi:hypothetical protein